MLYGVLEGFPLALNAVLHLVAQLLIHSEVLYLQLTVPLLLRVDEFGRHMILEWILAVALGCMRHRLVQELVLLRLLVEEWVVTFLVVWQLCCLGDLVVRFYHHRLR